MSVRVITGDCKDVLKTLPDESVHCVVTSPPYWGLRDYGTAKWEGGDIECDHIKPQMGGIKASTLNAKRDENGWLAEDGKTQPNKQQYGNECRKCGARRIDSQLGLEATPAEYVEKMVGVFREVRRVLRDDGVLFLNLGDSYAGSWGAQSREHASKHAPNVSALSANQIVAAQRRASCTGSIPADSGLKPKDLVGIPWMVAFALRADGWWLRQEIIWSKPNPMPESVRDRCTKAHESIFLLAKAERYYFDADAIAEPAASFGRPQPEPADKTISPNNTAWLDNRYAPGASGFGHGDDGLRNKRSVWTVATQPFSEAHFATFPPALIEPCILAGTSPQACEKCGAPWCRVKEKTGQYQAHWAPGTQSLVEHGIHGDTGVIGTGMVNTYATTGWQQTCVCDNTGSGHCVVLDPFGGAGTTGLVAESHNRNAILIELNPTYAEMARNRIRDASPLFAEVA